MIGVRTILGVLGIIAGIYLLYKIMFGKSKIDDEYNKVYDKILTSDEYKVKGQYDR